ncbi:hypothetical protein BDV39DRAFT_200656 [Aspergillus sergii]|uniref:NAD(P)-binding domain-containing protein n=1 Tax=Aspergillus sergii TaxID=1034303 RepID=A0A5N6XFH2_9EURO|nr:hypothetical protein BDV39DRAFT_200656 [Aspergillus sergii]
MRSTQIALAGATGNLGITILKALLDAEYHVTVLSRIGGNSSKLKPHRNQTIKEVDFTSVHYLIPALQNVDVVVSCLATSVIGSQNPLIDASVAAGVKRFIPADATKLADVAKGILGVIENQVETANRVVYIHSALVTQNRLIQYAKDKDGKAWETFVKDTGDVRKESLAELAKGDRADIDAAMLGFSIVGCGDSNYGCDFSGHLDNELLGVKEMSEVELTMLVESYLGIDTARH